MSFMELCGTVWPAQFQGSRLSGALEEGEEVGSVRVDRAMNRFAAESRDERVSVPRLSVRARWWIVLRQRANDFEDVSDRGTAL